MMNEDTLRRAVELLSPEWYITHIYAGEDIVAWTDQYVPPSFVLQSPPQWALDALAAALVRLVDATDHYDFTSYDSHCEITTDHAKDSAGYWFTAAEKEGNDPAENTINCIVEFDKANPGALSKLEASDE